MVNREWIINNLAMILGGRNYQNQLGGEMGYLRNLYQSALTYEASQKKLELKQKRLQKNLKLLPYNQKEMAERVQVSEDSVSDVPNRSWDIPESLTHIHCWRIAKQWLDFARQSINLKFMVADIVKASIKRHCHKCKSKFRLQVIQKIDFNHLQ